MKSFAALVTLAFFGYYFFSQTDHTEYTRYFNAATQTVREEIQSLMQQVGTFKIADVATSTSATTTTHISKNGKTIKSK